MRGVFRSATGIIACCEEEGCSSPALEVVGNARHLCLPHALEEKECWKALAHLGLRPMSAGEIAARKECR
jgi:hypothetical protein